MIKTVPQNKGKNHFNTSPSQLICPCVRLLNHSLNWNFWLFSMISFMKWIMYCVSIISDWFSMTVLHICNCCFSSKEYSSICLGFNSKTTVAFWFSIFAVFLWIFHSFWLSVIATTFFYLRIYSWFHISNMLATKSSNHNLDPC